MGEKQPHMRPVKLIYEGLGKIKMVDIESGQEISSIKGFKILATEKDHMRAEVDMIISEVECKEDIINRVNNMGKA